MICPTCKGGKTLLKKEQGKGCYEVVLGLCDRCHGTGEIEMTNEEYIRSCSVEELAEELLVWWLDGANTYSYYGLYNHEIEEAKKRIVGWLKEIHS